MSELTPAQIGARLSAKLTAAQCDELRRTVAARRRTIKARLASLQDQNGSDRRVAVDSFDPEKLAALGRETDSLEDEDFLFHELDCRLIRLQQAAAAREQLEAAHTVRKKLPALIERTTQALAMYERARHELADALSALGHVNVTTEDRFYVDDAQFEQIIAALHPAAFPTERDTGARAFLRGRICPPAPPVYSEPRPDYAAQRRSW
jgi:hypothetical protein